MSAKHSHQSAKNYNRDRQELPERPERPRGRQSDLPKSYRTNSPRKSVSPVPQTEASTSVTPTATAASTVQELSEREHDIIRKAAHELKMIREQQSKLLPAGMGGGPPPSEVLPVSLILFKFPPPPLSA